MQAERQLATARKGLEEAQARTSAAEARCWQLRQEAAQAAALQQQLPVLRQLAEQQVRSAPAGLKQWTSAQWPAQVKWLTGVHSLCVHHTMPAPRQQLLPEAVRQLTACFSGACHIQLMRRAL